MVFSSQGGNTVQWLGTWTLEPDLLDLSPVTTTY